MVVFSFSGRSYKARLLVARKAGETDTILFGLGVGRYDRPTILFRSSEAAGTSEAWFSPKGRLTPLMRAAIAALSA